MAEREWVFIAEDSNEELGSCDEHECLNAEDAMHQFCRECGEDFEVYFRTADGCLHSTCCDSIPEDF